MKPYWILRHHGASSIRSLDFAHNLLAAGDDAGNVSLVDLHALRPKWHWPAHTNSILTVLVISRDQVLTHGRDNELKLWHLPPTPPSFGASNGDKTSVPELVRSIGVNALNFSRCSYNNVTGKVAVPNALDAAYIDILDLFSGIREHEAVGRPDIKPSAGTRLPIVMSLHLISNNEVVAGYEDGRVKKWNLLTRDLVWESRCHSESVMSVSIHPDDQFGLSVGADDRIAHFDLKTGTPKLVQTTTPGKASTAVAPNGETFVVGGWDGSIRVYSTKDMTELGHLSYHRDTVECLSFAMIKSGAQDEDSTDDDSDTEEGGASQPHLVLAAGGRDGKISLWKYH